MGSFGNIMNRKELSVLVIEEREKVLDFVISILKGKTVSIILDGWTNTKRHKIINFLLHDGDSVYFWSSVNTYLEKNSGEMISELIISPMNELISLGIIPVSATADNAG